MVQVTDKKEDKTLFQQHWLFGSYESHYKQIISQLAITGDCDLQLHMDEDIMENVGFYPFDYNIYYDKSRETPILTKQHESQSPIFNDFPDIHDRIISSTSPSHFSSIFVNDGSRTWYYRETNSIYFDLFVSRSFSRIVAVEWTVTVF